MTEIALTPDLKLIPLSSRGIKNSLAPFFFTDSRCIACSKYYIRISQFHNLSLRKFQGLFAYKRKKKKEKEKEGKNRIYKNFPLKSFVLPTFYMLNTAGMSEARTATDN